MPNTVYIMVSKKLIVAWVIVSMVLFISILTSFQYANYVDRKSNGRWCGIFSIINNSPKPDRPLTEDEKRFAAEMLGIQSDYCN